MKDCVNTYDLYSPMPEHTIVEFISDSQNSLMPCNRVVLKQLNTGELTTVNVSFCSILIGFRPDLHFLNPKPIDDNKCITLDQNGCDHDTKIDAYQLSKQCQLLTVPAYNLLSRKIAWLKNLCAKCKHLSLCERSRRNDLNRKTRMNCVCLNNARNRLEQLSNDNNNNNLLISCQPTTQDLQKTVIKIPSCKLRSTDTIEPEPMASTIGEDNTKPIDCKTNPIAVDKFTNEVFRVQVHGLYAMGPLVGDNFIRFIPGGALAITSALHKTR